MMTHTLIREIDAQSRRASLKKEVTDIHSYKDFSLAYVTDAIEMWLNFVYLISSFTDGLSVLATSVAAISRIFERIDCVSRECRHRSRARRYLDLLSSISKGNSREDIELPRNSKKMRNKWRP